MSKRKLTFFEMCKRFSYYDFYKEGIKKADGTVVMGTMYKLDRMLTDKERESLAEFGNVRVYTAQCQYAPEIKRSFIFLTNKCI